MTALTGIVLVTGTDTGVGKTITTAAIAAAASSEGVRTAVVKPAQTGVDPSYGEVSDMDIVARLAAPATTRTLAEYPDPLAPTAAARVAGLPPLDMFAVLDEIKSTAAEHDLTLVEGAGGLLVPMGLHPGGAQWTLADLAVALCAPAVVVARAGLGTLNHTALTLEAMARRGITGRVVLGAWPDRPELVHFTNLADLPEELDGLLPDGAGAMEPGVFRRSAPGWLTPALYGACDDPRTLAEPDED
ncbi:ATP-dependent dethiobiotin synthetase BioD [Catellatospora methionotrophica]|uniref:ATP-dependent dethiobiotin synthetase BioD n=1 Tax=Catellatospora methionotrophica TaxID=121620 RepID=A0A8J3PGE8_9ACTN|nr:ATP-dependent dethiobiotin synthetase BioD [Catellatospora methionotrophica]